MLLLTGSC